LNRGGKLVWLDQGGGPPVGLFSGTNMVGEVRDIPEGSTLVICRMESSMLRARRGNYSNERLGALVAGIRERRRRNSQHDSGIGP